MVPSGAPQGTVMTKPNPLLDLANSSGFVFQLGVRHEIAAKEAEHGWRVLVTEHRWAHPTTGEGGFIDLILQHNQAVIVRQVVECKRATNRRWLFLVPKEESQDTTRISTFWTCRVHEKPDLWGWLDTRMEPPSPQAGFCVIQGRGQNRSLMLEKVTDSLLPSAEAVAIQEMCLQIHRHPPICALFLPVVVTNATLTVCSFDPGQVDMRTGNLRNPDFREVPLVRFRKSLSTFMGTSDASRDLQEVNASDQVTVLVVNSSRFAEVFSGFNLDPNIGSVLTALTR
jgi:hypothetical protein